MKLKLAIAMIASCVAGLALAQDLPPPPPPPKIVLVPGKDVPFQLKETPERIAARQDVRGACAGDMLALCRGKAGASADRCLVYHRLNFSKPCRRAITNFERAAAPIGAFDSLEALAPYSHGPAPANRRAPPPPVGVVRDVGQGA